MGKRDELLVTYDKHKTRLAGLSEKKGKDEKEIEKVCLVSLRA